MNSHRRIAILGSTGSIGTQALEVIAAHPDEFSVEVLTANNNVDLLIDQARRFKPDVVVIASEDKYKAVKEALKDEPVKVYAGADSLVQVMQMDTIDMVLAAMVGFAGLAPVLEALSRGKAVALANKETLVVAGELVTRISRENRAPLLPVDSEHSAIFQCLYGETGNPVEKLILTASGGPFRGKKTADLEHVTAAQALMHPNWNMGAKISIDSATLMNKGLEMIEARWLFGVNPSQIEVIVHPQSIIHSIVQFGDGSMKAQMGLPDMKLPIQVALAFPKRLSSDFPRFDFTKYPSLTFEKPDTETFRCLDLAVIAMEKGGMMPCVMNAANEVAVAAFLKNEIPFASIAGVIEKVMEKVNIGHVASLEAYQAADTEARRLAMEETRGKKIVTSHS
jgi:1-deoxy-D-xylulose-5-phosphate reductoisomerase